MFNNKKRPRRTTPTQIYTSSNQFGDVTLDLCEKSVRARNLFLKSPLNRLSPSEDKLSHHLYRLAFAASPQAAEEFVVREVAFFNARISSKSKELIDFFELPYETVSLLYTDTQSSIRKKYHDDKKKLTTMLNLLSMMKPGCNATYYIVPFEHASSFVSRREVYLKGGNAYVTLEQMDVVLTKRFLKYLLRIMKKLVDEKSEYEEYKKKPLRERMLENNKLSKEEKVKNKEKRMQMRAFEQLEPILEKARRFWEDEKRKNLVTQREVRSVKLSEIAKSTPLCISRLSYNLNTTGHLKNTGRTQLRFFLKSIGLSVDQSLDYWGSKFSDKSKQHDKTWANQVKHAYSKPGNGCSCATNFSKGDDGEGSGCPFKEMKSTELKGSLKGVSVVDIEEIVSISDKGMYRQACGKLFETQHPGKRIIVSHPTQYYNESVDYIKIKN